MIQIGNMIEMISQEAHDRLPQFYSPVGTRGIVLRVHFFIGMLDLSVQWERGPTSGDDVWTVGEWQVRKV